MFEKSINELKKIADFGIYKVESLTFSCGGKRMGENMESIVNVIGHINPDTDSICSAIAYAELKSRITGKTYVAKRAGQINSETQFVFGEFC